MAITQLMEWRLSLLQDGRFEDFARQCIFPMVFQVNGSTVIVASPEAMPEAIRSFCEKVGLEKLKYLKVKVTSVELPRNGRFRVWSELVCHLPGCPPKFLGRIMHCMRETPKGVMSERLECDCPEMVMVKQAVAY